MFRKKLVDVLSLCVAVAIGADLVYTNVRLRKLERIAEASPFGEPSSLVVGAKFLPSRATSFNGRTVDLPAGHEKLIFYLSTHCGACAKQLPDWSQAAQALGKD